MEKGTHMASQMRLERGVGAWVVGRGRDECDVSLDKRGDFSLALNGFGKGGDMKREKLIPLSSETASAALGWGGWCTIILFYYYLNEKTLKFDLSQFYHLICIPFSFSSKSKLEGVNIFF